MIVVSGLACRANLCARNWSLEARQTFVIADESGRPCTQLVLLAGALDVLEQRPGLISAYTSR